MNIRCLITHQLSAFSILSLLCLAALSNPAYAAESKNTFDLILPYTDITVGQGQDVTMDAEVVNRG